MSPEEYAKQESMTPIQLVIIRDKDGFKLTSMSATETVNVNYIYDNQLEMFVRIFANKLAIVP